MNKASVKKMMFDSGDAFMPFEVKKNLSKDYIGNHKESFYIDKWSIIHLITGCLCGFLFLHFKFNTKFYFLILLILHILWELWQIFIGSTKIYNLTGKNTLMDSFVDTIMFMIGAYIVYKIKKN